MPKSFFLEAAGVSDVGKAREHNEDSLISHAGFGLYAIADGMGGHLSGEVASQATIEKLVDQVESHQQSPEKSKQDYYYETVVAAVGACNNLILKKNNENGSRLGEGMGTTLVGLYFLEKNSEAVTFNVGDSRIYRFRDNELTQITRDHTMYQEWYEAGQKGTPPSKNILVKAIGLIENVQPDVQLEKVQADDIYLICSDGLSNLVDDETVTNFIRLNQELSADEMCRDLIVQANNNGGDDNISVVIIKTNDTNKETLTTPHPKPTDSERTVQRKSI